MDLEELFLGLSKTLQFFSSSKNVYQNPNISISIMAKMMWS